MKKKSVIITSAIILGIVGIGGTATYATTVNNHKEIVAEAKSDIDADNKILKELADTINNFELEGGYLSDDLTEDNLIKIEDSLKQIKDTYTDNELEKDELNDEIKTISDNKKEVDDQFKRIQSKFESQELVNSLFSTKAIEASTISDVAVADNVDSKAIESVSKSLASVKEDNDWYLSLESLVKLADGQLVQIDTAKKAVDGLYKDDNVKEDVTMKQYDEAKDEVDFVKNESVQKKLEDRLAPVLKKAEEKEEKARKEAEEKADAKAKKAEEEARAQAEQAQQVKVVNTQSIISNTQGGSVGASAGGSSSSSDTASTSGSSSSTGGGSYSSDSSSTQSASKGASSGGSSSKPSGESNSSSKSPGSSSSYSKSNGGKTSTTTDNKTGGGVIKNSDSTYEEYTFSEEDLDGVPWDELNK